MSEQKSLAYALDLGGYPLAAREVSGRESLSSPFRFEVRLRPLARFDLHPDRFVKAAASIVIQDDVSERRRIEGVVTDMSVSATVRGLPEVHVVLEPRLALLRFRKDTRVFRDRTVPEIVTEVLSAIGVRPDKRLGATYERRAYCVQYDETDFDFVHRLLEDEGIFYFFGAGGGLVLGDNPGAFEPLEPAAGQAGRAATLPFRAGAGLDKAAEVVCELGERAALGPARVSLRDWTPDRPSANMDVSAPVPGALPGGAEVYDYPGEYTTVAEGERKARIRAEALSAAAAVLTGTTLSPRLFPGAVFALADAPGGFSDGELLVTSVDHDWQSEKTSFSLPFEAIEAERPFRPLPVTASPQIWGPLTGVVTGPAGEDIHTDSLGRVKVRFCWDRRQPLDDSVSDWIPVIQDNTGHSMGIPRIGWEVMVGFLEGNPDRPVVMGRLYNGADPFPETLPQNKTMSALRSVTSPGRQGSNVVRMDDAAGRELMFVHAERDQRMAVANDKRTDVGSEEIRVVEGHEKISIGANDTALVGGDVDLKVGGDQTWSVGAKRSVQVGGSDGAVVEKDHLLTVGGAHLRRVATEEALTAKELKERVGAVVVEAAAKKISSTAGSVSMLTVGGAVLEVARQDKKETARLARVETVGGLVLSKSGDATKISAGGPRVVTVGGSLTATADGPIELTASELTATIAAEGTFAGASNVTLQVGDSQVVLANGVILIKAPSVRIGATGAGDVRTEDATLV